ncbi:hypothetical protein [Thiomonas intermedia]|uniref:hypothetical protein n=1 Tax=Thiomonas intermedia TaxID=926 RepID=UPI0009A47A7D|nr:hypothetical protein [Thiomonas intermedia]
MKVQSYVFFNGRCAEAFALYPLYPHAFDAVPGMLLRYRESPEPPAMPLGKTFFAPCFGMLTDRYSLGSMTIVNT